MLNQHIFNVKPKVPIEMEYLQQALGYVVDRAKSQFHGIEMTHITKAALNKHTLLNPPIAVQRDFSWRVAEVRALEAKQAESRRRLEELFASLLHWAFRGEV